MINNTEVTNEGSINRRAGDYWNEKSFREKIFGNKPNDIEMRKIMDTFLWDCGIIDEKNETTVYEGTEDFQIAGRYVKRKGFKSDYRKTRKRYEYENNTYHIDGYSKSECQGIIRYIKSNERLKKLFREKSIHKIEFNDDKILPFSSSENREKEYSDSNELNIAVAKIVPKIWQSISKHEKPKNMSYKSLSVKISFKENQVLALDFHLDVSRVNLENPEERFAEFCPRICDFIEGNKNIIISINSNHIFTKSKESAGTGRDTSGTMFIV